MPPTHRINAILIAAGLASAATAQVTTETIEIGTSASGQPIQVFAIGEQQADELGRSIHDRPALLVVAGTQGHHRVGADVARMVAEQIGSTNPDIFNSKTLYVLPQASPDSFAWLVGKGRGYEGISIESARNQALFDADGDRRVSEDGADDLNGDGLITMMRVSTPSPSTGLTAEYVADEEHPRLMRKASRQHGDSPQYAILIEGIDNDTDGSFNEDGPGGSAGGGYNYDANFPSFWPEHREDAGLYPLDQQAARALVEWTQSRTNIAAVLVYAPHDNLINTPKAGQYGPNGRMPKGLEKADEPFHKHVAEKFKAATNMTGAVTGDTAGAFSTWAYADLGVWTFSTPVWTRPDQVKEADAAAEPAEQADAAESSGDVAVATSEYDALIERGIPQRYAALLTANEEDRAAMIAEYENSSPEEQAAAQAEVAALPQDIQTRIMAVATGGADPAASEAETSTAKAAPTGAPEADEAEVAWLTYSDEQRNGEGFVDWVEVNHPQFGTVEVGGFVPGFRFNPPESELQGLADQQVEFVSELIGLLPDLQFGDLEVESLGAGLHHVTLTVSNPGYLPTAAAIGMKARRIVPVVAVLEVPIDSVLAGNRVQSVEQIEGSGGTHTFEWTIRADEAAALSATIRSGHFGTHSISAKGGAQ